MGKMKYGLSGRGYGGITKISRSFRTGELLPTQIELDPPKPVKKNNSKAKAVKMKKQEKQTTNQASANKVVFSPSSKYLFIVELETGQIPNGKFALLLSGYRPASLPDDKVQYNDLLIMNGSCNLVNKAEIVQEGENCIFNGKSIE